MDRTALEVFASDGLTYVPLPFTPKPEDQSTSVNGGTAKISTLEATKLNPVWSRALAGCRDRAQLRASGTNRYNLRPWADSGPRP